MFLPPRHGTLASPVSSRATAPQRAATGGGRRWCDGLGGYPQGQAGAMEPPAPLSPRLLAVYLNDHLAVAEGALALARRMRSAQRWGEHRALLDAVVGALHQHRAEVGAALAQRSLTPRRYKLVLVRLGELGARLKLNGRVVGPSPLSRLVELDGLALALTGCAQLWTAPFAVSVDAERDRAVRERLDGARAALEAIRAEIALSALTER